MTEQGYSIAVDLGPFAGSRIDRVDERTDDLMEALLKEAEGPVVSAGAAGIGLRFSLVFPTRQRPEDVIAEAAGILARVLANIGLGDLDVTMMSVETDEHLERENATPNFPELVGLSEIAGILGVSKQRVAQLRDREDFPKPVAELAAGPVWSRWMLERFIEEWPRRGGRAPAWRDELAHIEDAAHTLTGRDLQIFKEVVQGRRSTKELAQKFGISEEALRSAIRRMVGKVRESVH
jgi:hypothetical protein